MVDDVVMQISMTMTASNMLKLMMSLDHCASLYYIAALTSVSKSKASSI